LWVSVISSGLTKFIFEIIAAPLFLLAQKDSGYKGGPLPKDAMDTFCMLQNSLTSEPIVAFPQADRQYALITDAATGMADIAGSLGAILTQKVEFDNYNAISCQLKDHKKITHPFYSNLLQLCGEWTFSMNTSKVKNSFFSLITNH
jgi:hypothetical protein